MMESLALSAPYATTKHPEINDHVFEIFRKEVVKAKSLSYSPYSKFRVGAVVLVDDDTMISGANVENASYGACICAERAAVTRAVMMGHMRFKAIGVSTDLTNKIASPCGICRQFIREFGVDISVYLFNHDGSKFYRVTLEDILPLSFGPEDLDR